MKDPTKLLVKKYSVWNKSIGVDWRTMFKGLIRVATDAILPASNPMNTVTGAAEVFTSIKAQDKPEHVAYQLIFTALREGLMDLVDDNANTIQYESSAYQKLLDELSEASRENEEGRFDDYDYQENVLPGFINDREKKLAELKIDLDDKQLKIGSAFLRNPRSLSLLNDFKPILKSWLIQVQELPEHIAEALSNRFPSYFVLKLHAIWRSKPGYYGKIEEQLDLPTTAAVEKEIARIQYNSYLQSFFSQTVFDEAFTISDVYIPLRAFYSSKHIEGAVVEPQMIIRKPSLRTVMETHYSYPSGEKNQKDQRHITVLDAEEHIINWLTDSRNQHAFMIVKGGPGSGKSVLARRIAAIFAQNYPQYVYYIPMHIFMLNGSVREGIRDFIKSNRFLFNEDPFDQNTIEGQKDILFVFDGLDELAQAGVVSLELAKRFVGELQQLSRLQNDRKTVRVKFLLTGRDLVIQQNENGFDIPSQIIRLMPYHSAGLGFDLNNVNLGRDLFRVDQRPDWWKRYWKAKGKIGEPIPGKLFDETDKDILSISSEPLLNYLLARVYELDSEILSKDHNLNEIYESLIIGVYQRDYETKHDHKRKYVNLSEDQFRRILEEIAVAAWHGGDVRAVPYSKIRDRCIENNLGHLLSLFGGMQEEGFMKLLVSFFFHQKGIDASQGEKTFEFTHKSFGEFLTAIRIFKEVQAICDELDRENENSIRMFGKQEAISRWYALCGPTEIGSNIIAFFRREVSRKAKSYPIRNWQETLVKLLNHIFKNSWPIGLTDGKSLKAANQYAKNSEETLILCIGSLARITQDRYELEWESDFHAGEWLSFLRGQPGGDGELALSGLNGIDFRGQILNHKCFIGANLERSIFSKAEICGTRFDHARLKGAILNGCKIDRNTRFSRNSIDTFEMNYAYFNDTHLEGKELRVFLESISIGYP